MTFYQELQLNQAGSKDLLKKSETAKEKNLSSVCIYGEGSGHDGVLFFICYYFQHSAWK